VEWLGDVPKHWKMKRLKQVADVRGGVAKGKDQGGVETISVPYLRVANVTDAYLDLTEVEEIDVAPNELERYLLRSGDVLMNEGGDNDKLGRGHIWRDEISPCIHQNHVFSVRPHNILSEWLAAITSSEYAKFFFMCRAKQSTNLASISLTNLSALPIVLPPEPEQTALVQFLDRETAKIDTLIAEQQDLIALLREKRQAIISHAVTKGLNPGVPMKHSGIEWLGDVPEHWEIKRLKQVAEVRGGVAKGKDQQGGETISVPYLRVANVQDGYLDLTEIAEIEIAPNELDRYLLKAGDVLMNEGGDYDKLGRGHIWRGEISPCIHQNHVFSVRPYVIRSEWLAAITSSDYAKFFFMCRANQSTNLASISLTNLSELPVTFPPALEQLQTVGFLERETAQVDTLIQDSESTIALLQEHRTALISAVVTGKVDVREVACV
jgi:type I restriction enzyme S subunit